MNDVAATFAMGINNPAPTIAADSAASSLSAPISQYFIGGMTRVQLACACHQQDTKKR